MLANRANDAIKRGSILCLQNAAVSGCQRTDRVQIRWFGIFQSACRKQRCQWKRWKPWEACLSYRPLLASLDPPACELLRRQRSYGCIKTFCGPKVRSTYRGRRGRKIFCRSLERNSFITGASQVICRPTYTTSPFFFFSFCPAPWWGPLFWCYVAIFPGPVLDTSYFQVLV